MTKPRTSRLDVDAARIAWLSIAAPLLLIVLLCAAKPAHAETVEVPPASPPGLDEEFEEEFDEEGCEEAEEGFAGSVECEEVEEEEEAGPYPPEECILRTAHARAFTYSAGDKLRLVIRYTSTAPADVSIGYRLKGGRGALNLGQVKRHFGRSGLFQITEKLSDSGMSKAQAARNFVVKLSIASAPGYCNRYYTRHLTAQRAAHNQVVWLQSDSVFGT